MRSFHIKTQKTARVFQLGEISENTKEVIIVCHGYAQLAKYFLKWFQGLENGNRIIIAPEGLSRFYWKGFSDRVVASWMTKEDRASEIEDYVNYLNQVVKPFAEKNLKIITVGFSQGAATVARWVNQSDLKFNHCILIGGVFPPDIDYEFSRFKTDNIPLTLAFGDEDEFYDKNAIQNIKDELDHKNINYNFSYFKGKHKVYLNPLKEIIESI